MALALERTFLAWLRTALSLMGFGFVVARFGLFLRELERARSGMDVPAHGVSPVMGVALVVLGILAAASSTLRFQRGLAEWRTGRPVEVSATVPTLLAVLLCGIGLAAAWSFVAAP